MELFAKSWTSFKVKKCAHGPWPREEVLYTAAKVDRTSEIDVFYHHQRLGWELIASSVLWWWKYIYVYVCVYIWLTTVCIHLLTSIWLEFIFRETKQLFLSHPMKSRVRRVRGQVEAGLDGLGGLVVVLCGTVGPRKVMLQHPATVAKWNISSDKWWRERFCGGWTFIRKDFCLREA